MNVTLFENIALGLSTALTPENLLYCLIGVTLGNLVGVIPGIGALAAMSLLFPITFHLEPVSALVMLGGIYYGTTYGGSTASILLNLPGLPSNAVACLDGYPMAKQGRAGVALFMTTIASFVGGSIGIVILMLFSPVIAGFALQFGPAEYFSLMVMGLVIASLVSDGSAAKGLAMMILGILIGLVGMDMYTGAQRYTFGRLELMDGISLVAVAMGLFGVSEVIASISKIGTSNVDTKFTMRNMLPTRDEAKRSVFPMLRGTGIGAFFGALPGTGATVAAFMAYAVEKRVAKDPSRFGHGAIEGVTAPESANNASDQTSFIPTLTLGVPGNVNMAIVLGVLMVHGITPGPTMMVQNADVFWGLVMSFWIGNILLVLLNVPLIGVWVRVLQIPYRILYPSILVFVCIGVYTISFSAFDVMTVLAFGVVGYGMRVVGLPAAPLLLGYVLGPMMEEEFRRAMLINNGDFTIFVARPISLGFIVVTAGVMIWALASLMRRRKLSY